MGFGLDVTTCMGVVDHVSSCIGIGDHFVLLLAGLAIFFCLHAYNMVGIARIFKSSFLEFNVADFPSVFCMRAVNSLDI